MGTFLHQARRHAWSLYGRLAWTSPAKLAPETFECVIDAVCGDDGQGIEVLDAGCGTGEHVIALAGRNCRRAVGIDFAPGMIRRAAAAVPAHLSSSIEFRQTDLSRPLPFPQGSFDRVLSVSSLHMIEEPVRTLRELRRVLRASGRLVILHAPAPEWYSKEFRAAWRNRLAAARAYPRLRRPFVLAKAFAERAGATRHWTRPELEALLALGGFVVERRLSEQPIILDCAVVRPHLPGVTAC